MTPTTLGTTTRVLVRRAYEAAVMGVLLAASGYGLVHAVVAPAALQALRVLPAGQLAALTVVALVGTVMIGAGVLGPVWVTAAEDRWRAPRGLLARRRRMVAGGSLAVAAACGAVGVAVVPGSVALPVLAGAVLATLVGCAVAGLGQQLDLARTVRTGGSVLVAVALGAAALLSGVGWAPGLVAVAGSVAVVVQRVTSSGRPVPVRWRPAPPRWELRRAGAVADGALMATVQLDSSPFAAAQDAQLAPRRRPLMLPVPLRPAARLAGSARVVAVLPLVALPAVAAPLTGRAAAVGCLLVLTYAISIPAGRPLDALVDSPALRRTYALSRPRVELVLGGAAVVVTGLYAWLGAALSGLGAGWPVVATAVAGLAWARRRAGRRLAGRVGPLLATPMGAVPVDLAQRVLAGTDVLLVALLVLPGRGTGWALLVVLLSCGVAVAASRRGR